MKNLIFFMALILASFSLQAEDLILNNFSTDGCSSYPDGNPLSEGYDWIHCCVVHDYAYWIGGTSEERYAADEELAQCVAEVSREWHGTLMGIGVNIGGTAFLPTKWKWGFGWENHRLYEPLSNRERELIKEKIYSIEGSLMEWHMYLDDDQWNYVFKKYFDLKRTL